MGAVLTTDEAKQIIAGIGKVATTAASDEEIDLYVDAAEGDCAAVVGPLAQEEVTVEAYCHAGYLDLPVGPAYGTIAAAQGDDSREFTAGASIGDGTVPLGWWTLTYTAGWATVPPAVKLAVRDQFRHLWSQARGNTRADQAGVAPKVGMPRLVADRLAPYRWGTPLA